MKKPGMRLIALLTALMMLGIVPAFAQAPAQSLDLLQGKTVQTDVTITLNPMVGNLIANLSGSQPDEAGMAMFNTVINAINKLKASFVANEGGASGTLGTDKGNLLDFQVNFDKETSANHITSSLLPGLALSVDPEMMKQVTAQSGMPNISPEELQQLVLPYATIMTETFTKAQASATSEEGSYEIAAFGTFTKKTEVDLTSHMLADLMEKLAAAYKNDTKLQALVKEASATAQSADLSEEVPQDPAASMEETAKSIKSVDNMPVLHITAYENAESYYFVGLTPDGQSEPMKIDLFLKGINAEASVPSRSEIKLALLSPGMVVPAEGEAVAPTDWALVEEQIRNSENLSGFQANLNITVENAAPVMNTIMDFNMLATGMNIGLNVDSKSDIATLESTNIISLNYKKPDMVKLAITTKPSDAEPVAPALDGAQTLVLKQEMSEEDSAALETALQQALPQLLEQLNVILPEEAPALLALLEGSAQTEEMPEPAPANP